MGLAFPVWGNSTGLRRAAGGDERRETTGWLFGWRTAADDGAAANGRIEWDKRQGTYVLHVLFYFILPKSPKSPKSLTFVYVQTHQDAVFIRRQKERNASVFDSRNEIMSRGKEWRWVGGSWHLLYWLVRILRKCSRLSVC